jgi:hypothetical protein
VITISLDEHTRRIAYFTFIIIFIVMLTTSRPAFAQTKELTLQALNGKNGKPLTNQRLLFFAGLTEEDARHHSSSFEARTNASGLAVVQIDIAKVRYLQVFADFMTVCIQAPNNYTIALSEIMNTGGSTPNTCGTLHTSSAPGKLTIYAREATLKEKMDW